MLILLCWFMLSSAAETHSLCWISPLMCSYAQLRFPRLRTHLYLLIHCVQLSNETHLILMWSPCRSPDITESMLILYSGCIGVMHLSHLWHLVLVSSALGSCAGQVGWDTAVLQPCPGTSPTELSPSTAGEHIHPAPCSSPRPLGGRLPISAELWAVFFPLTISFIRAQ